MTNENNTITGLISTIALIWGFTGFAQSVFGFTDWLYLDKTNETGPVDIGRSVNGIGNPDGDWSFDSSIWSSYNAITIVLKDGGTVPNGDKWSAYYIDPVGLSSGW